MIYLGRLANEYFVIDPTAVRFLRLIPAQPPEEELVTPIYKSLSIGETFESEHLDPMRPELRQCDMITPTQAKPKARLAHKLLKRLSAPPSRPPLLLTGPSVAYAKLQGDVPSVALLPLSKSITITEAPRDQRLHLGLSWQGVTHHFPLSDEIAKLLSARGEVEVTNPKAIRALIGFRPKYALLAFGLPEMGYCRKTVVALLP